FPEASSSKSAIGAVLLDVQQFSGNVVKVSKSSSIVVTALHEGLDEVLTVMVISPYTEVSATEVARIVAMPFAIAVTKPVLSTDAKAVPDCTVQVTFWLTIEGKTAASNCKVPLAVVIVAGTLF